MAIDPALPRENAMLYWSGAEKRGCEGLDDG